MDFDPGALKDELKDAISICVAHNTHTYTALYYCNAWHVIYPGNLFLVLLKYKVAMQK